MRYKPERALKQSSFDFGIIYSILVEMRYKPERALKLSLLRSKIIRNLNRVEMRYKPERALKHIYEISGGIDMR